MAKKEKTFDTSTISDLALQEWFACFPVKKLAEIKAKYELLEKELVKGKKQVNALKASKDVDPKALAMLEDALSFFVHLRDFYKSLYTLLNFLYEVYAKATPEKRDTLIPRVERYFQGLVRNKTLGDYYDAKSRKSFPKSFAWKEYLAIMRIYNAADKTVGIFHTAR